MANIKLHEKFKITEINEKNYLFFLFKLKKKEMLFSVNP